MALLILFGCDRVIPVMDITVVPNELTLIEGKGSHLEIRISPSNATDVKLLWSSSAPEIAQINENGWVSALSLGTATISVTVPGTGVHGTCQVTVSERIYPSLKGLDGYELAWNDEFDYFGGPCDKWKRVVWKIGTVNRELQKYVDSEDVLTVSNGTLKITAYINGDAVLSGRLHSKQLFQHGYFEARVKIPEGKGVWPAFWLMSKAAENNEWPLCGEVDILEAVGHMPETVHSVVWAGKYCNNEFMVDYYLPDSRADFHIYAAEITSEYVKIFVDSVLVNEMPNEHRGKEYYPYNDYLYMVVLNLAFGGTYGGAEGVDVNCLPAVFEVDYVRVFTKKL